MKECYELGEGDGSEIAMTIELDFQHRQKSRHRGTTTCGETLGWFLQRGRVLRDGDILQCSDGSQVLVVAAPETVSQIDSDNPLRLLRAAYHLGNRHVPLQIGEGWLRYQHDHVLDEMVIGLGLQVECCQRPFHPESGAYSGRQPLHSHAH